MSQPRLPDSEELVASFPVMLQFIMVGLCTQLQLCRKEAHFDWLGPWVSLRMERACCGKLALRKRMPCPTNHGFGILTRELWWIIQWFRCYRQLTELKKAAGCGLANQADFMQLDFQLDSITGGVGFYIMCIYIYI